MRINDKGSSGCADDVKDKRHDRPQQRHTTDHSNDMTTTNKCLDGSDVQDKTSHDYNDKTTTNTCLVPMHGSAVQDRHPHTFAHTRLGRQRNGFMARVPGIQ